MQKHVRSYSIYGSSLQAELQVQPMLGMALLPETWQEMCSLHVDNTQDIDMSTTPSHAVRAQINPSD